jgi:hypothetical protein
MEARAEIFDDLHRSSFIRFHQFKGRFFLNQVIGVGDVFPDDVRGGVDIE